MERTYPDKYFLVIYFHHYLVDSVSAFCLKQAERSGGFKGSMEYLHSTYVSKEEFHAVLDEKSMKEKAIRKKAEANRTPLIDELKREGFCPLPSSFNEFIWTSGCKFHRANTLCSLILGQMNAPVRMAEIRKSIDQEIVLSLEQ